MNLTDLTEVLRRHAELPPDAAHGPRMSGIQARVKASRRRRVAAVAASLVAVLGVSFALTLPVRRESQPAEPVVFSEYHEGTRIVAQTSGRAPESTITLRFVLTALDTKLFIACDPHDGDKQMYANLFVNGVQSSNDSTCTKLTYTTDWTEVGIGVGTSVTVTASAGEQQWREEFRKGPIPPDATFGLAVGVPVTPEDYPFPPRPESLKSVDAVLDRIARSRRIDVRRADQDQPNGTWRTTVTWPKQQSSLEIVINTPGRIRVLVDDVVVAEKVTWTYDASPTVFILSPDRAMGENVDITVIAERTSGDWAVILSG